MKKVVLAFALVLCVCALPSLAASSDASCPVAPAASVSNPAGTQAPIQMIKPFLPYCWNLNGTYCSPVGSTTGCQDGIWFDYVCTCRYNSYYHTNYWDCPEVR